MIFLFDDGLLLKSSDEKGLVELFLKRLSGIIASKGEAVCGVDLAKKGLACFKMG